MIWQDWVLPVGNWIFFIALMPSILGKDKPALSSSLVTGVTLGAFAFTFATLNLWVSAFSATLTTAAWLTLAWQKFSIDKKRK